MSLDKGNAPKLVGNKENQIIQSWSLISFIIYHYIRLTVTYAPLIVFASATCNIGNMNMGSKAVTGIGIASVSHSAAIMMIT